MKDDRELWNRYRDFVEVDFPSCPKCRDAAVEAPPEVVRRAKSLVRGFSFWKFAAAAAVIAVACLAGYALGSETHRHESRIAAVDWMEKP